MPLVNKLSSGDENSDLAKFIKDLEHVTWFAHIGNPMQSKTAAQQMFAWGEWPGPEDPSTSELPRRQQELHDELMRGSAQGEKMLSEVWNTIHSTVLTSAAKSVPYKPDEDAWYAPNVAVWHAAWTASLVGLCLYLKRPVPEDLQEQWNWFLRGHWPYGCLESPGGRKLLVY